MNNPATCSIEDCDKPTRARGWCATHWGRWRKWGDPLAVRNRWDEHEQHGAYRYQRHGCRCDACVAGNREKNQKAKQSARRRKDEAPHGTTIGYDRFGCRCNECRAAHAEYRREQLANDPEARSLHLRRALARSARVNEKSREVAVKNGDEWTGPELEFVLRDDLTVAEMAAVLHRTVYAVQAARRRVRTEPRYIALAGAARDEH